MQKIMAVMLVLALAGAVAGVQADELAGAACATSLTPDGKAIYAVVAAANPSSETLRSVTEHETRSLAVAGKIGRSDARENAVAAGECMKARLQ